MLFGTLVLNGAAMANWIALGGALGCGGGLLGMVFAIGIITKL